MKKIEIKNRYTGAVLYATEVEDGEDGDLSPMRTAVARALVAHANLTDANLTGADLAHANLARANLTGANLTGANLTDANLTDANLTGAREDFRSVLDSAPNEVTGLLLAIREGRIDGSHYEGECACLVGTIANVRGCNYQSLSGIEPNSSRPSERLFMGISPGHVPAINPVAKIVEGWIVEWQSEHVPVVS